mmetsp:Transcript_11927/g.22081  ORF Transcript_11927/g.22081 Transcript_11927/m.22081 type:complete len:688 (+) Transcript_11927:101-2164(+)|eukprot:CAMPEP_0201909450 /NCGR_PEP_ID=MMETSP0903-20130614/1222_1 /ASSEMBLY_ACC=CAM_ASM_000552 /TAXON_ID=420261 /ORGANISM="Thalassiosira antarctica, Strain CCMP982" /LENGTH=687 /DNA_ID=CAMNT_0048443983 /DNA_START=85 /DNA_END=2148 /DNA_ORIENTATION=+
MGKENGIKGNKGDFLLSSSSSSKPRSRKRTSSDDGGAKIIVALLAGAGAAFLLALLMLMSRLEADEINNGLLNSNVGGTPGVDDQIYLEEVAQGHASPALLQQDRKKDRQNRLVKHIGEMESVYDRHLKKFDKMFNLPKGNPLDLIVHEGKAQLEGMKHAMEGKGKLPEHIDLESDFKDAIDKDNQKEKRRKEKRAKREREKYESADLSLQDGNGEKPPHLYPLFPPMPPHIMAADLFGEQIITNTLSHDKPTVAGIVAILQRFLRNLHQMLVDNKHAETPDEVIEKYFALVTEYLEPLEEAYRDRSIFPIREDESIFMSLGAYRDHLLGETLRQAFKMAANPDKLFVGAVVQNCFGIGVTCRTGVEVKGKDQYGHPLTEVSDRPPDVNGIEQFCADPDYTKYCDSGQIRALYVNETESNGPTTARYFASKLWGGETYFVQADAHLRFAPEWDRLYAEEVKLAKGYPKAILSAYPPGFSQEDPPYAGGSRGTRLCTCTFSDSDVEHKILRINTGNQCRGEEKAPTQIAYIAAGFFFARAEFLIDVPFDPYMPWCFMGEEIALSLRSWTHGWDIYAPRKNLIAHQYRPGRMGLPKFWENTGRVFGRPGPGFNTRLQTITIQRIKYMVGYKESSKEWLESKNYQVVLTEFEHYGPGDIRTMEAFLEHTKINLDTEKCGHIDWCNDCTLN